MGVMSLHPPCAIGKIHSVPLGRRLSHWWDSMWDFQGRKTGGRAEGAGKLEQRFASRKTPFPSRQDCIQKAWLEDILGAMGIIEFVFTFTVLNSYVTQVCLGKLRMLETMTSRSSLPCICKTRCCSICFFFDSWDKLLPALNLQECLLYA